MEPLVLRSFADGVTTLTFNRPAQRNAMSAEMMAQLHEELQAAAKAPDVRCVVMQGAGGNFVAGGDIKSWARLQHMTPKARGADFRERLDEVYPLMDLFDVFEKPLIAAVRGHAAGAGLGLVLAADFVMAEATAQFHFANIRAALTPDMCISYYLPRVVGEAQALRLSLLGSQIDAARAEAIGLASHVVPPGEFDAALGELCATLVRGPARAIAETKRLFRLSRHGDQRRQFEEERDALARCASDDDFVEAVLAFAERRNPKFGGFA